MPAYPMVKLPTGDWVRVDLVASIKVIPAEESLSGMNWPDRLIVTATPSGEYVHRCDSLAEAIRLRDELAAQVAAVMRSGAEKPEPASEGYKFRPML